MALIIDKIVVTKHAQERLNERQVPWPHRLTLFRMSNAEAGLAKAQFKTDNPKHQFRGKAFKHGTDLIYATARDNRGKQPVYILKSMKNRRYKLITCWWIDTPIQEIKEAIVTPLTIVHQASEKEYGNPPNYSFKSTNRRHDCVMHHPSGRTAIGSGTSKSKAKVDAASNYLKLVAAL